MPPSSVARTTIEAFSVSLPVNSFALNLEYARYPQYLLLQCLALGLCLAIQHKFADLLQYKRLIDGQSPYVPR